MTSRREFEIILFIEVIQFYSLALLSSKSQSQNIDSTCCPLLESGGRSRQYLITATDDFVFILVTCRLETVSILQGEETC